MADFPPMSSRLQIGEFELQPATRRLFRGGGSPVHLANRPFQVLLHLVTHRGRLVSRAELLEKFWDGRDVYEGALTRCLSTVRKALGDQGSPPRFIETRWAEGYRYVGPCVELPDRKPTGPSWSAAAARLNGAAHRAAFADSRNVTAAGRLVDRGNAYLHRSGHRSYRYALAMYRLAAEADPEDPRAHGGIAAAHALLCLHAEPTDAHRAAAAASLATALEIDGFCAEVQHARAHVSVMRDDYATANAAFRAAESLAPGEFGIWYYHARGHAEQGDHEGALAHYLRAAQADPGDYQALALAEQSFNRVGLHADARIAARACARAAEDILRRCPDDVRALSLGACVLHPLGRRDEARGWTERAVALEPREPFVNFNASCIHIALGDLERALHFLKRVTMASGNSNWIAHDPCIDPVRSHPRFSSILSRAAA
jgi:DNA-binding winged helix-turn-helix (wHTH) protein/Flp pilus assembly protein TadD